MDMEAADLDGYVEESRVDSQVDSSPIFNNNDDYNDVAAMAFMYTGILLFFPLPNMSCWMQRGTITSLNTGNGRRNRLRNSFPSREDGFRVLSLIYNFPHLVWS